MLKSKYQYRDAEFCAVVILQKTRSSQPIFYEQTIFLDEERCIALVMFEGVGS